VDEPRVVQAPCRDFTTLVLLRSREPEIWVRFFSRVGSPRCLKHYRIKLSVKRNLALFFHFSSLRPLRHRPPRNSFTQLPTSAAGFRGSDERAIPTLYSDTFLEFPSAFARKSGALGASAASQPREWEVGRATCAPEGLLMSW
jgi:hypothetical protein